MTSKTRGAAAVWASLGALGVSAALIAVSPWPVAFGAAVTAAYGWCRWLDVHPGP
jgi:hypothetical protein